MANIKNKQIDILKAYEDSLKDPHRYDKVKMYAAPIIIVTVTAVTTISFAVVNHFLDQKIATQDSQITTTKDAIAAADKDSYNELKTMTQRVSTMSQINTQLKNQIKLTGSTLSKLDKIASAYDITYTGVSYSKSGSGTSSSSSSSSSSTSTSSTMGDTMTISGNAETPDDIEDYVQKLRETTKNYTNIVYTGYTASTTETTGTTEAPTDDTSTSADTSTDTSSDEETTGVVQGESDTSSSSTRSGEKTSTTSSSSSTSGSSSKKNTGSTSSSSSSKKSTTSSYGSANKSSSSTSSSSRSSRTPTKTTTTTDDTTSTDTSTTATTTTQTIYTFTVTFALKK